MQVENGREGPLGGVLVDMQSNVYYHKVKIKWMGHIITVRAGFSNKLSVLAILGRDGFFDNFSITFDCSNQPAGMNIERIYRA